MKRKHTICFSVLEMRQDERIAKYGASLLVPWTVASRVMNLHNVIPVGLLIHY